MTDFKLFIGYPSDKFIEGTIEAGVSSFKERDSVNSIGTWKALDNVGAFISDSVIESIDACQYFVADITKLNFNVTYEVGYAISKSKPILLTINSSLRNQIDLISQLGIFDTIGYDKYENSDDFYRLLRKRETVKPLQVKCKKNNRTPVYLLKGRANIDQETRILSRVSKAKLSFRQFDPNEQSRLSAHDAMENVYSSYGVLVYLLPDSFQDAFIHNLRAAFIIGLAHGLGIRTSVIQFDESPVPLDYRDFVDFCLHPNQIDEVISEFGIDVFAAVQEGNENRIETSLSLLEQLNLGASSAENELRDLGEYYLKTDAFMRADRGEVRLIVGRKGSGKSAIFFQIRDRVRRDKSNIVLGLKPEGYQLLKFKDQVLSILNSGSQEHTITAFWEYLLLLEVCQKLLEKDKLHHTRDHTIYDAYQRLSKLYIHDEYIVEGDFSERMSKLLESIRNDFQARYSTASESHKIDLSQAEITELIYKHDVNKLRQEVFDYMVSKGSLWILFDNVDKGWPAHGLKAEDLIIIRTLIEATRKIERDLQKREIEAHTLIFIRNDVYELLIEETPDRGKEPKAIVDWHDPEALKEMVKRRIQFNGIGNSGSTFEELWSAICVSHVKGEESFQYLLDRCLMRPRFLIDLINACKGNAITLRHEKITEDDIFKGLALFSDNLVTEVSYELRDVFPQAENVIYSFIGSKLHLSFNELKEILIAGGINEESVEQVVDALLWYSFLGFQNTSGEPSFIYTFNYNIKIFKKNMELCESPVKYVINTAFIPALGIANN